MLIKKTSYFHFSVVFVFDSFVIDYDENKEIGTRDLLPTEGYVCTL